MDDPWTTPASAAAIDRGTTGGFRMALEMREHCEKCSAPTFCAACRADMATVCPNCGGELVRRPGRRAR